MRNPLLNSVGSVIGRLVLLAVALTRVVCAEEPAGKIAVEAVGTASVKPDVAEVQALVSGNATLAADAIKKYRDNRRRAFELLDQLKLKDLLIEGHGPGVNTNVVNNGQQGGVLMIGNVVMQPNGQGPVPGITFAESLVIRLRSIDRMKDEDVVNAVVKILDAAKDAGMQISGVQFSS